MRSLAIALLVLGGTSRAAEDPHATVRAEFRRAYDAALEGDAASDDSRTLRAYPLYPYLERARIAADLRGSAERAARGDRRAGVFLARHATDPIATELRVAWLTSLARRAQWRLYVEHYRPSAEAGLRCDYFNARIALDATAGLAAEIAATWLTPQRLPEQCIAPFEWLESRAALGPELIEQRVRLLLENGEAAFARTVARDLEPQRAAPLLRWADMLERPRDAIDSLLEAREPFDPDALLAGWTRLARTAPTAALERYDRVRHELDDRYDSRVALALALGLAWDRRPDAAALFADVAAADLDDYAHEWRARSALWAREWRTARAAIEAMSAERAGQARWRYWAARSAAELGEPATAAQLYAALLPTDNYYAALAAARLGRRAAPHPAALPAIDAELAALERRPSLIRARELFLAGLPISAAHEWSAAYAGATEPERKQLVHLAARWGWHDVAVATATREGVFFDYAVLYPQPYPAEVRKAADAARLATPLIYGVVRQESLYRADAISSAGAMGLAQLTPATARLVARQTREPAPAAADLLDPTVNLRMGATYLRLLIDRYGDQLPIALAAYNAGPNAAERWLPETALDADIWIENIPYNETREYVQRVLWHSVVFGWLDRGAAQDTSDWLTPVTRPTPRVASTGVTSGD